MLRKLNFKLDKCLGNNCNKFELLKDMLLSAI